MKKSLFSSVADNSSSPGPALHRGNWSEEQQRVLDKTKVFVDDIKRSLAALEYHSPNAHHEGDDSAKISEGVEYGNFPNPRIVKQLTNRQRMLETYLALDHETTLRFYAEVTTCGLDKLQQYTEEVKKRGRDHDFSGLRYEDAEQGFRKLDVHLVVLGAHRDSSCGMLAPALMEWRTKAQDPIRMGILIGPFFLDWNEHNLVIPRKIFASAASSLSSSPTANGSTKLPPFSVHIGTCQVWEVAEKVADIVVDFNCNRTYSEKLNSQAFVYAILEKLGLHKKLESAFRSYTDENVIATLKNLGDAITSNPDGINWQDMTVPDVIQSSLRELVLHISGGPGAEGPICKDNDQSPLRPISGAFEATSITVDSLLSIVEDGTESTSTDDHNKPKKRSSFKDLLSGSFFGRKQRTSMDLSSSSKRKSGGSSSFATKNSLSPPPGDLDPQSSPEMTQGHKSLANQNATSPDDHESPPQL